MNHPARTAFVIVPASAVAASLLAVGIAACAPGPQPTAGSPQATAVATAADTPVAALVPIQMGLPYRPDVQFAPLYLAQDRGYYEDAGLDVQFVYGEEDKIVRLVAAGERDAMIASGDQVILARAAGIPVTYVATWFQRFPVAVMSTDTAVRGPQDLIGKKVGLPSAGGTSALGWQGLLLANGIAPESVTTEVVGYEQVAALKQGRVDAAVVYATNEPLQFRAEGIPVSVIEIADTFNMVANGMVVSAEAIQQRPEVVQGLVTATLKGIRDALADPDAAFAAALTRAPEAGDPAVRDVQRQVLEESLRFWRAERLGAIDAAAWEQSQATMQQLGLVKQPTPLDDLVDARFADGADLGTP